MRASESSSPRDRGGSAPFPPRTRRERNRRGESAPVSRRRAGLRVLHGHRGLPIGRRRRHRTTAFRTSVSGGRAPRQAVTRRSRRPRGAASVSGSPRRDLLARCWRRRAPARRRRTSALEIICSTTYRHRAGNPARARAPRRARPTGPGRHAMCSVTPLGRVARSFSPTDPDPGLKAWAGMCTT